MTLRGNQMSQWVARTLTAFKFQRQRDVLVFPYRAHLLPTVTVPARKFRFTATLTFFQRGRLGGWDCRGLPIGIWAGTKMCQCGSSTVAPPWLGQCSDSVRTVFGKCSESVRTVVRTPVSVIYNRAVITHLTSSIFPYVYINATSVSI